MRNPPRYYNRRDRDPFLRALAVSFRADDDLRLARDMERLIVDLVRDMADARKEIRALRRDNEDLKDRYES